MIWNKLKKIFVDSVSEVKGKGHSSTPQRQAIINRKKKKKSNKRFIQNWRLIFCS